MVHDPPLLCHCPPLSCNCVSGFSSAPFSSAVGNRLGLWWKGEERGSKGEGRRGAELSDNQRQRLTQEGMKREDDGEGESPRRSSGPPIRAPSSPPVPPWLASQITLALYLARRGRETEKEGEGDLIKQLPFSCPSTEEGRGAERRGAEGRGAEESRAEQSRRAEQERRAGKQETGRESEERRERGGEQGGESGPHRSC